VNLFVSYRRDDTASFAGRLYDRLVDHYDKSSVFIDVDSCPIGVNFHDYLDESVKQCEVMLVLMGDDWLEAMDDQGNRRLDSESDFVRIEIELALKRGITIVPVRVGSTLMPKESDLPESIKEFPKWNGQTVDDGKFFHDNVNALISGLDSLFQRVKEKEAKQREVEEEQARQKAQRRADAIDTQNALDEEHQAKEQKLKRGAVNNQNEAMKDDEVSYAEKSSTQVNQNAIPSAKGKAEHYGNSGTTRNVMLSALILLVAAVVWIGWMLYSKPPVPYMVAIPAGSFEMGDLSGDGRDNEKPVHTVNISKPFAMSVTEVTFAQYDAYVDSTEAQRPADEGWGRGNQPVINVSWNDAQGYIEWLNKQTEGNYRLPSEAEWEYAARAGTTTKYSWGDEIGVNNANCVGCGSQWDFSEAAPVGSFAANPFGLYDMHGNVCEMVQDIHIDNYSEAPDDGTAVVTGGDLRSQRGGCWASLAWFVRGSARNSLNPDIRLNTFGFRLAQDITL